MWTSMNWPWSKRSRSIWRSARNGEMNEARTTSPASTRTPAHLGGPADVLHPVRVREADVAVEPVTEDFSVEEVGVEPQVMRRRSTKLAMVDLPAPDRPETQTTFAPWWRERAPKNVSESNRGVLGCWCQLP